MYLSITNELGYGVFLVFMGIIFFWIWDLFYVNDAPPPEPDPSRTGGAFNINPKGKNFKNPTYGKETARRKAARNKGNK